MLEFSPDLRELEITRHWLFPEAPETTSPWHIEDPQTQSIIGDVEHHQILQHTTRYSDWKWPKKNIHFISDIHADADALISSLVLSGTIKKTGLKSTDFILTPKGKKIALL